ncbi:MAG: biotin/lipoyl-containing protein [Fimbriimonadaceae bacterium]
MKLKVTVDGKAYEVEVEVLDGAESLPASAPAATPQPTTSPKTTSPAPKQEEKPAPAAEAKPSASSGAGGSVKSPIAGTVTKVNVAVGDQVTKNQPVVVLEAMKMESDVASPQDGKVSAVLVQAGQTVSVGQVLVEFE